ncbi:hypothetical protein [Maricaulis sp.]|uniref:hypothetical protein n=1 Tax=Maricaulis sp. TaxID=1486257 RepID=UPI00260F4F50|nr:hypothetical protein [Maricaulis sp.]
MFNVIPLLIVPVIAYAVIVIFSGGDPAAAAALMDNAIFSIPLVSGPWSMKVGDLLIILAMLMLFIELVKSAGTGTATIINHGLSMAVFVIAMALFLLVGRFGTSVFFLITMMALMDTVAGFVVTIVAARRDLAVGGE